jgi:hypothetical protein
MKFVQWMDDLPLITKVIFCLPFLHIFWGIYRIVKGSELKNTGLIVVGIIWIIPGGWFLWLVDLVTTLMFGKSILTDPL